MFTKTPVTTLRMVNTLSVMYTSIVATASIDTSSNGFMASMQSNTETTLVRGGLVFGAEGCATSRSLQSQHSVAVKHDSHSLAPTFNRTDTPKAPFCSLVGFDINTHPDCCSRTPLYSASMNLISYTSALQYL